ncbi:PREDICTED: uncharacterized protein LOC109149247 [Ipomoea nil]|uniref:uncharacterized protein LOC109149247 n=1 Tax=Ipomoea nil TaxID=35883 RepID=UPI000900FC11|nr:PREDICTED: uncharacterized protein LOC109149247 [Ipomoea nil]
MVRGIRSPNSDIIDSTNIYSRRKWKSSSEKKKEEVDLSDSDKKQFTLVELDNLLSLWGKSLKDFSEMSISYESNMGLMENMLIAEELAYDKDSLKIEHEMLVTQLTDEQNNVYDYVMNDIDSNGGGLFFVYG